MGCKLCLEDKKLCDSHIIPEFFYKAAYENHTALLLSTSSNIIRKRQKGVTEYLLCSECEQFLNHEYEQYAYKVFYGKDGIVTAPRNKSFVLAGIDYTRFKLFQLSVLWRASVTTQFYFSAVDLGHHHNETIRKMILNRSPGRPEEYCCFISYLMALPNCPKDGLLRSPVAIRDKGGHRMYQIVYGGSVFYFVVSSHYDASTFNGHFLDNNGNLPVHVDKDLNSEFLTRLAGDVENALKKRKS